MKFKLIYRGEVKSNPKRRREHVHDLRMVFHKQMKRLFEIKPYSQIYKYTDKKNKKLPYVTRNLGGLEFVPFISPDLNLLAELDITLMHPELIGTPRADIDNRMKTLLDALKMPHTLDEIPPYARNKGDRVITLLEDDRLVTKLSVNTSHLLDTDFENEVFLLISVTPKVSEGNEFNLPFVIG
jgi:hypothetical protein